MGTDCEWLTAEARLSAMRHRAADEGIPLHATLALTHRCNFRCVHCYVLPNAKAPETELSTEDWLALAQEAADAGCFSILLTGGEPLLREDFADIYLGIRKMGVHVMLFTNASRVDERVIEILQAAPPRLIEVTLYGATPETVEAVTGHPDGFKNAVRGVALLRKAGLPVRLKTVLMQPNRHEFETLRNLAAGDDLPLRYDAMIQPRFSGDTEIERLRIPPAEVAEMEARLIPELAGQWKQQQERQSAQVDHSATNLYACAAGAISFYVSADGMVQPCVSAVRHGVRYERGDLLKAFREGRQAVRSIPVPVNYECAACDDRVFCGSCPPVAELDCGDECGKCAYACALAHERGRRSHS
jgi:MoaA/NifB/PqqE/SkfB family radical SAM enzyme